MLPSLNHAPSDPPERFVDLVRDALLHLYDFAHLRSHPLASLAPDQATEAQSDPTARAHRLRRVLLDCIDALRVAPGTPTTSRDWRIYHILEQRYIEGLEAAEVIEHIALSRAQYHREHQRAVQAVAAVLWGRWRLTTRWSAVVGQLSPTSSAAPDLAREEAVRLIAANHLDWIDLGDLLHGVSRLLQPLCAQHNVSIALAPVDSLSPIRGNRIALRNALLALLSHGIHVTTNGHIGVAAIGAPGHVEIQLAGRMQGEIDAGQLGVAEAQPFVDAVGGSLSVTLPSHAAPNWEVRVVVPTDCRQMLVVDNNTDFIRLVERFVAGTDWQVIGCNEVESAWAFIQNRRPDAILLDVVIPGRDGWELLVELRSQPLTVDVPVIVCSVLQEPELAISLGATSYLPKPITRDQLVDVLHRIPQRPAG